MGNFDFDWLIGFIVFVSDDDVEKTYVEDVTARVDRWRNLKDENDNDNELNSEISAVLSEDAESARAERWKRIQNLLVDIEQSEESSVNENDNSQTDRPYTERPINEPSHVTERTQDFTARTVEETNGVDSDPEQHWEPNINYSNENIDPVISNSGPFFHRKSGVGLKNNIISADRSDSSLNDGQDTKKPFLPEINRSGSLVSQDFSRVSSAQIGRSSASSFRTNIYNQDSIEILSIDGECLTPKPPDSERPSSSKSRTVTPLNR